ncbi:hypothetical protein [Coleofasciculus sp. FACHB-129]|uniref:hypothetical protein n=1 Tax=Cyanophyceae TaxID=3028117 RepID=UPI001682E7BD|nr:hypothetical protein [Coleofasciculus sp. FACHB-129]MBD1895893.1 hypothetical protein [Coleofasciculus sp. FACHB-129]
MMTSKELIEAVQRVDVLHPLALEAFGLKIDAIADAVGVEVETLRQYRAGKNSRRRRQPGRSTQMLAANKAKELVATPMTLKYPHFLVRYLANQSGPTQQRPSNDRAIKELNDGRDQA